MIGRTAGIPLEIESFHEDFRLAEELAGFSASISERFFSAMRHFAYLEDNNGTGIIRGSDLSARCHPDVAARAEMHAANACSPSEATLHHHLCMSKRAN